MAAGPVQRRPTVQRPRRSTSESSRHRLPTITLDGEYDPFTPAGDGSAYRDKFTGKYAHRTLKVGHNVPQEAPQAFAEIVVDVDGFSSALACACAADPAGPIQAIRRNCTEPTRGTRRASLT